MHDSKLVNGLFTRQLQILNQIQWFTLNTVYSLEVFYLKPLSKFVILLPQILFFQFY